MRFAPAVIALACLFATTARAAIYENTVTAEDEDDIFAAEQRGDISSATADTLLEIIREGVDLNSAGRDELYDLPGLTYTDVDAILEYRKAKGRIEDPAELVGAGAITAEQLLQIAPFIRIDADRIKLPIAGKVRAVSRFTNADNVPPPAILGARLKGPFDLSGGFLLFTSRRLVATPSYDPVSDALQTPGFGYHVHLPRGFLQWKPGKRRLIAGTFTVGFAERLTLDNTRRITPTGFYLIDDFRRPIDLTRTCKLSSPDQPISGDCASGEKNVYITPDFDWREVFRGVAGSIEDIQLGQESTLSMYGFLSYQSRSIYQYELFDRRFCADPRDDNNDLCKAPPVYLPDGATRLIYGTLPYIFDELTGGGHVTYKPNYRLTFGVTGYGSVPFFKASPAQLDFQEWSRYPNGGAFGALGINGHASWNDFNFFLEATRSFDHSAGNNGGGWGVEQRTTFSPKGHEVELSLRYYDLNFANTYARPVSSPDEYDGLRARNELGARVRYLSRLSKDWELRTRADFWLNPYAQPAGIPVSPTDPGPLAQPAGVPNLYALARLDFTGWDFFQPAVWVDIRNRNLPSNERGRCASGTVILTEGTPYVCNGDLYRVALRLEFVPHQRFARIVTQGWLTWTDDIKYKDRFRNALMVWAEVRSQPFDWLQLRVKTRYSDQDLSTNTYLEENVWTFLEATWIPTKGTRLSARYDVFVWLDQRNSTLSRVPNPEHRFMLDVRTQF